MSNDAEQYFETLKRNQEIAEEILRNRNEHSINP